jgi:hypothetical protein
MKELIAVAFEIVDHGIDHSQYFQGCGTSFTEYTMVATGIGDDYKEALDDALESLAQAGWNVDIVVSDKKEGGESVSALREEEGADDDDGDERNYIVSVRVREYDPEKDEEDMKKVSAAIGRLDELAVEIHNAQTPSGDASLLPGLRKERDDLEDYLNEMDIKLNNESLLKR